MLMHLEMVFLEGKEEPFIAATYENGHLYWFNSSTRNQISDCAFSNEPLVCFTIDQKAKRGIAGGAGDKMVVFSFDEGGTSCSDIVKEVGLKNKGVNDIKIRTDGKIFASAGWDHRVRIFSWKKHQCKPLAILRYHKSSVQQVAFPNTAGDNTLATTDAQIAIWNIY